MLRAVECGIDTSSLMIPLQECLGVFVHSWLKVKPRIKGKFLVNGESFLPSHNETHLALGKKLLSKDEKQDHVPWWLIPVGRMVKNIYHKIWHIVRTAQNAVWRITIYYGEILRASSREFVKHESCPMRASFVMAVLESEYLNITEIRLKDNQMTALKPLLAPEGAHC